MLMASLLHKRSVFCLWSRDASRDFTPRSLQTTPVMTFCFLWYHLWPPGRRIRNRTVKDIFANSPSNQSIIEQFIFQMGLAKIGNSNIHNFAKIRKSFKKTYVCYSITMNDSISFPYYDLLIYKNLPYFYTIYFKKEEFQNASFLNFYLDSRDDDFRGLLSLYYTTVDRKLHNDSSGFGDSNGISLSYSSC